MSTADVGTASGTMPQGGCYRIQVLVVGRHKRWRDEAAAQVRLLGYQVTACDRGVDAMTVLALGLERRRRREASAQSARLAVHGADDGPQ